MAKQEAKFDAREMSIADAVSDAFSELSSLGEEMRESFDNTPESLQQSGVGEARGEAADALENLNEPSAPEKLGEIKLNWSVRVLSPSAARKQSRSDRRWQAIETLNVVVEKLEDIQNAEATPEDLKAEVESFLDDVQQLIDEAGTVEFPGMYG